MVLCMQKCASSYFWEHGTLSIRNKTNVTIAACGQSMTTQVDNYFKQTKN